MTDANNAPGLSPIYAAARQMLDALGKGATSATATVQGSTQVAHLVDGGNYRALTVDDAQPLHDDTLATWAAAFGVELARWDRTYRAHCARLEWATDGESRSEGSRVTWIGGAK